jgi:hypothetical protein
VKLTPQQRTLLRALNKPPVDVGIYAGGKGTSTGMALVRRGLAEETSPRRFVITDKGKAEQADWAAGGFVD